MSPEEEPNTNSQPAGAAPAEGSSEVRRPSRGRRGRGRHRRRKPPQTSDQKPEKPSQAEMETPSSPEPNFENAEPAFESAEPAFETTEPEEIPSQMPASEHLEAPEPAPPQEVQEAEPVPVAAPSA